MTRPCRKSQVANPVVRSILGVAALLGASLPTAAAADDGGWDWIVVPYLWAATIESDLGTGLPPPATGIPDSEFSVLDKLDGAFQIHIEGQGDRFGLFADFTYLGLGDERDRPNFRTEADIDARLFELAGVWNASEEKYLGLELFAGLRYIDLDLDVNFIPVNPTFDTANVDVGETYYDFMFGARYTWALSDRWKLTLRGDGSVGDTEGTWNASAVASYRTNSGAWFIGYRFLAAEFDSPRGRTDIDLSGVQVGYGFFF